jgi:hypothetical protein
MNCALGKFVTGDCSGVYLAVVIASFILVPLLIVASFILYHYFKCMMSITTNIAQQVWTMMLWLLR